MRHADRVDAAAIGGAVAEHWGLRGPITELDRGSTARAWRIDTDSDGPLVARLTDFPRAHVELGLRVAEAVDDAGITAGRPLRTLDGAHCVEVPGGRLALLRFVPGRMLERDEIDVAELGRLLARVHVAIAPLDGVGAWSLDDACTHLRDGLLPDHPAWVRPFVDDRLAAVEAWEPERLQVTRGDGPEVRVVDGAIVGMIDWGACRWSSVADDIGIWTVHLGPICGGYDEVVSTFVDAYRSVAPLTAHDEASIEVFQGLRLADRPPYVTDAVELARIEAWVDGWLTTRARGSRAHPPR